MNLVVCLTHGGNLGRIHATVLYLSISIEGKRPIRVIMENHGCKFTHPCETAIKPTNVCAYCVSACVCVSDNIVLHNIFKVFKFSADYNDLHMHILCLTYKKTCFSFEIK
jgi:hypothetical protein